ncbi:cuticle protein 10.9 [Trichonephila clavipes]|uniref:Cuticle protein 10.9 n=1 Tax=Trichonephila clavipes TaxID=2585209 RepID=A0A8X6WH03_TRICX|nr:cuticle protein 10.9 [Trichonephila clavipes]
MGNSCYCGSNSVATEATLLPTFASQPDMTFWEYTSTGLAADEACPLCDHARIDSDHLLQCTRLDEYPADDIVSWYWKAGRQMVKKPSTGAE